VAGGEGRQRWPAANRARCVCPASMHHNDHDGHATIARCYVLQYALLSDLYCPEKWRRPTCMVHAIFGVKQWAHCFTPKIPPGWWEAGKPSLCLNIHKNFLAKGHPLCIACSCKWQLPVVLVHGHVEA
jgi:hypothetical protein